MPRRRPPVKLAPWLLAAGALLCVAHAAPAQETAPVSPITAALTAEDAAIEELSRTLLLRAGQVESVATQRLERVAVGDPSVADVVVLSESEVLIKAITGGSTELIIWDAGGMRKWLIEVAGPAEEAGQPQAAGLRRLLNAEGFGHLPLRVEGEQTYVSGTIQTAAEEERLTKLLDSFPNIVNLVQRALATAQTAPLVELEVQVIEVSKDLEQNLGVDWSDKTTITETVFNPGTDGLLESLSHRVSDVLRVGTVTRGDDDDIGFTVTINHLLKAGKGRILAAPNLVTLSGKPASTFLGGEIPVVTATSVSGGVVSTNIEFMDIGTRLTITPTVSEDGAKINSAFESQVRSVDNTFAIVVNGITVPGFKVRNTKTEVMSAADETIVIAGLLQDEESEVNAKVPKLHKTPLFGRLFRNANYKQSQTELLVIVTPRLPQRFTPVTKPVVASESERRSLGSQAARQPSSVAVADTDAQRWSMIDQALSAPASAPVAVMPAYSTTPAPVPVAAAGGLPPTVAYARQVQERIARGLATSGAGSQAGGAVRLQMRLQSDGTVGDVRLLQSSGNRLLDDAALSAARRQGPYPVFPAAVGQPELVLELPVVFANPG